MSDLSTPLVLAGGLGAIFVGFAALIVTAGLRLAERSQVNRSLAAVRGLHATPQAAARTGEKSFRERVAAPAMTRLTGFGRRFTPTGQLEGIRRRLELAGNPTDWDVDRILAYKMLGLLVGAIGGAVAARLFTGSVLVTLGVGLVAAALGLFTPDLTLYQLAAKRGERMQKDLPDAFDMLTISVEAGLAFDAAMAQVARNTTGPLAEEFFRVLQEMQIGLSRADALRALSERTDLADLRVFVTAIVQADKFGIPIASVLRVQAKEMRTKRSQRAEEKAQKVPVKILFPLIFCIMPALFIVIIGPAGIEIFRNLAHHGG